MPYVDNMSNSMTQKYIQRTYSTAQQIVLNTRLLLF
jgi:hypothetical protein